MPKFVLFSNHAETIASILHSFDFPMLLSPEPSYMILVNFYLDTASYDVDLKQKHFSKKSSPDDLYAGCSQKNEMDARYKVQIVAVPQSLTHIETKILKTMSLSSF